MFSLCKAVATHKETHLNKIKQSKTSKQISKTNQLSLPTPPPPPPHPQNKQPPTKMSKEIYYTRNMCQPAKWLP